jgi:hypothetical protein
MAPPVPPPPLLPALVVVAGGCSVASGMQLTMGSVTASATKGVHTAQAGKLLVGVLMKRLEA